jgi:mono/diheme cytochrome c family protein
MVKLHSIAGQAAFFACVFVLWFGGCGFVGCARRSALTAQQLEGRHLYQVRCAHCHEENDLELKKPPPDLHGLMNRSKLPSGIAATDSNVRLNVLHGRGMMPGFAGRFTEDQMQALLAYLHSGLL